MEAVEAVQRTKDAVVNLPAGFMLDGATYERGGALGFEGIDFYTAGRAGALGDVPGCVVAAAFVFFHPPTVEQGWERSAPVMDRRKAADAFASCLVSWAQGHLADGVDYTRLAALAGRIVDAASPAGAPLFAAWRTVAEPDDPKALALHRMNALRELRGAAHGAAVLTYGIAPLEAVLLTTPFMAGLFGWPEPYPDVTDRRDAWDSAEEATDRRVARAYGVLDPGELDELAALMADARSSAT